MKPHFLSECTLFDIKKDELAFLEKKLSLLDFFRHVYIYESEKFNLDYKEYRDYVNLLKASSLHSSLYNIRDYYPVNFKDFQKVLNIDFGKTENKDEGFKFKQLTQKWQTYLLAAADRQNALSLTSAEIEKKKQENPDYDECVLRKEIFPNMLKKVSLDRTKRALGPKS